jgi:hypothetical protein
MKRFAKAVLLTIMVVVPLVSAGCVYAPPRAYYGSVWVPAHWGGPAGNVWIAGHWR